MRWKLLTAQIREEIYYSLTSRGLFPEKQNGCWKGYRGTENLLYIDQQIHNESKTRRRKFSYGLDWQQKGIRYCIAKLDYKLPQNVQIVQNIRWSHKLYRENHENLKSGIDTMRKKLSGSEGPKWYVSRRCTITMTIHNCMKTLKHIPRKCTAGYKLSRSQEKINQLIYMGDIKMFAKNEKEQETQLEYTMRT